jgi:16S rRNA (cytidine1402-2'-O)-methyltransferase
MEQSAVPGTLYIVSTPIGNLDDMTFRAVKILSTVDLIAAEDTRTTKVLLDHYHISRPMVSYFSHNQKFRTPQLVEQLRSGQSVALVSDAGTPGISDPAYQIVKEAIANGVPVIPIPGASALLSALVVSGLPTHDFVFEGFLPQKKGRKTKLEMLKKEPRTLVFYESPHRIMKTLNELHEYFGERQVVVAREITKKFEETTRGNLSEVIERLSKVTPRGEYVIVLGGNEGEAEIEE